MTEGTDRRTDHARRRRVEMLIAHVRSARDEIIDRGLDAVHVSRARDRADAPPRPPKPPRVSR
jgi:hypothetical protein